MSRATPAPGGAWTSPGVAVATAVAVTGVVLARTTGPGHRLVRDFVAVPDPAAPGTWLPTDAADLRAWPLDAVTWAAAGVVPTGTQQLVLLAGVLLLAAAGAGLLVRRHGVAAVAVAAVLAAWNPYVTERLLLGQVPTLLGYAVLPWVWLAARTRRGVPARLGLVVLAALPAALTPWGGAVAAAAAVVATATRPDRSPGTVLAVAAAGVGWCLPWLVPGLLAGGVPADGDGAVAFALADDTGLGTWGSALLGGGIWATGARPGSRGALLVVACSVLLLGLAVLGAAVLARRHGRVRGAAALGVLLGPASVLALLSGPLLPLAVAAQAVPGAALLRDQHRLLAPAVVATAVLAAVAVSAVRALVPGRAATGAAAVVAVALAVGSVPDQARAVGYAYTPVAYPAEWTAVVAAAEAPGRPVVLSLPWQPLRVAGWAPRQPFLDPLPRAVAGTVLVDGTLTVRRDGRAVTVDDGVPGDPGWRAGEVSAASLHERGVTTVVEWLGTPGALPTRRDGWVELLATDRFRVWDVRAAR